MSRYTMTLQEFYEYGYTLNLNNYPIFNEEYRNILNYKILNHFKFNEIGYETPSMFKSKFELKMLIIMPMYNEMYKAFNDIDTLLNVKEDVESVTSNTNTIGTDIAVSDVITKNNVDDISVTSNTPKQLLSIDSLQEDFYADLANKSESTQEQNINNKTTNNNDVNTLNEVIRNFKTTDGNKFDSFVKLKNELYNIDLMLLEELECMFIGLYN